MVLLLLVMVYGQSGVDSRSARFQLKLNAFVGAQLYQSVLDSYLKPTGV